MTPALTISEADWQKVVLDYSGLMGWRRAHFRAARTARGFRTPVEADGAGFPDLVLVRAPELVFAELKAERGRTSPAQREWLAALRGVAGALAAANVLTLASEPRVDVYEWRPSDWPEVERRLRRPE
jgi:hypothetical protein